MQKKKFRSFIQTGNTLLSSAEVFKKAVNCKLRSIIKFKHKKHILTQKCSLAAELIFSFFNLLPS